MIDLHTHSRASDGSMTPEELVLHAGKSGITVLALTDHDSVSGIEEARTAAKSEGIIFVPGIELDISWHPGECHLLGYGVGRTPSDLGPILLDINAKRRERNLQIVESMRAGGIDIDLERVEAIADGGTVGRPHLARFLAESGVVKNVQQAFDKYLATGRPYYVDRESISLEEGIAIITESGGIPVLAHPLSLYVSWGRITEILASFRDKGVRGLEAWHPGTKKRSCERLEALARDLGMFVTGGSDFHGAARPDRKLGKTVDGRDIDDRFYFDELLPALS
ncbi:MAG TPA: PHP domain-containing protein [Treponema sp.]|nr:PHP domain-containing protein [Treponema sp.]